MDSKALVERVRVFSTRRTDYQVAKMLEMSQSDLIRVKQGETTLGPRAIMRVSEITGEPLQLILAIVEREKARSPGAVEFWEKRLPRSVAPMVAEAPRDALEPLKHFAECIRGKIVSVPPTLRARVTRAPTARYRGVQAA